MIKLFKKSSKKDKLNKEYERLMKKSFELSKVNRTESDRVFAQAQEILDQMESLD